MAIALFKNKQDKMAGDALNNATKFMTEPRQKVSIGKATIKGLKVSLQHRVTREDNLIVSDAIYLGGKVVRHS